MLDLPLGDGSAAGRTALEIGTAVGSIARGDECEQAHQCEGQQCDHLHHLLGRSRSMRCTPRPLVRFSQTFLGYSSRSASAMRRRPARLAGTIASAPHAARDPTTAAISTTPDANGSTYTNDS